MRRESAQTKLRERGADVGGGHPLPDARGHPRALSLFRQMAFSTGADVETEREKRGERAALPPAGRCDPPRASFPSYMVQVPTWTQNGLVLACIGAAPPRPRWHAHWNSVVVSGRLRDVENALCVNPAMRTRRRRRAGTPVPHARRAFVPSTLYRVPRSNQERTLLTVVAGRS